MNQYRRIYIAGPLTPRSDDQNHAVEYLGNCRQMFRAWLELAGAGWHPFCPAVDFVFFFLSDGLNENLVKENSLAWLEATEAIVLLPGWENSFGAKAEFELAVKLGKKVFYSIEEANKWLKKEVGNE